MVAGEGEGGRIGRSLRNREKPPPCYSQHLCSQGVMAESRVFGSSENRLSKVMDTTDATGEKSSV